MGVWRRPQYREFSLIRFLPVPWTQSHPAAAPPAPKHRGVCRGRGGEQHQERQGRQHLWTPHGGEQHCAVGQHV